MQIELESVEEVVVGGSHVGRAPWVRHRIPTQLGAIRFSKNSKSFTRAIMIIMCVIPAFIVIIIQQALAASLPQSSHGTPEPKPCETPGCAEAAENLLEAMNETVDPCVDFFQFACGKWTHDNSYSKVMPLQVTILRQLAVALSLNVTSPSQSINNARNLFATCMDIKKIDEAKTGDLSGMLAQLGGWPLLTDGQWNESRTDISRLIADIRGMYGVEPLISMSVSSDMSNSTQNIIYIEQPELTFQSSEQYLLPEYESHRIAYKKLIYEIASLILSDSGMPIPKNFEAAVQDILSTEVAIVNIMVITEGTKNLTEQNNHFTISELYEIVPQLDWLAFVRASAPSDAMDMIRNDTNVIVGSLKYLQRLSSLLQTLSPKQLADMIMWQAIYAYHETQGTMFQKSKLEFDRMVTGNGELLPRYSPCKDIAAKYLPLAVSAMYVRHYFSADDKKEAMAMVSNVREAFRKMVGNLDWMDNSTKESTLEKERNIVELVGYPDFILDPTLLDKKYEGFQIWYNDSLFEQIRKLRVWTKHNDFRELRTPTDRSIFSKPPAEVDAAYVPTLNSITVAAAILQPPFFKHTYPKYVNYGAIGSVVGHEITHGFDNTGSQYDQNGNVANWWSNSSAAYFAERTQCMVNQYNNYTVPGTNLHANGAITLGENIADNGGVKASYEAYRAYVKQHGEEPRLPGLQQYTPDQLFFLSFAQFYCDVNTPEVNIAQTLSDTHSLNINRVLGALSNMPQFASAFQCASGTPYNPHSKCSVW